MRIVYENDHTTVEILTQHLRNESQTRSHQPPLTSSMCAFVKLGGKGTVLTGTSSHMSKVSQKMAESVGTHPKCLR